MGKVATLTSRCYLFWRTRPFVSKVAPPKQRYYLVIAVVLFCLGCAGEEKESDRPQFRDVAADVGLDFMHGAFRWEVSGDPVAMMGGGLCWIDYDSDGWLDLYVVNSYAELEAGQWQNEMGGLPTNALFRNENGQFRDVSVETQTDLIVRGNGCVAADFDDDGHTDIYVTTSRVNQLLWNNGDGTFSEGAVEAGVNAYGWQTAAAVGDVDLDGDLDLFTAGYVNVNRPFESPTMSFPNTFEGLRDLLYLNQGERTFLEFGLPIGIERGELEYGLGALLSDVDRDGDLDLFVANDTNQNRLYENVTERSMLGFQFEEIGRVAAVDDTNSGMGVAGGDFDGDGTADLFITNMGEQPHSLYQNIAPFSYIDVASNQLGVGWTGWGTSWFDADHDGDLDLFVANGAIPVTDMTNDAMLPTLYQNEGGILVDWTAESLPNKPLLARGSAVADYDNDGDLDIAINSIGSPLTLLQNEMAEGNWVMVAFDEVRPGTIVEVILPDGTVLLRELVVGSSYLSSEDMRVHVGVGAAETVDLRIQYLDGSQFEERNVRVNQVIEK